MFMQTLVCQSKFVHCSEILQRAQVPISWRMIRKLAYSSQENEPIFKKNEFLKYATVQMNLKTSVLTGRKLLPMCPDPVTPLVGNAMMANLVYKGKNRAVVTSEQELWLTDCVNLSSFPSWGVNDMPLLL